MKKQNLDIIPNEYIFDKSGKKIKVILDVATFDHILELLEDASLGIMAKDALDNDEFIDFDEANKKILKK